MSQRVTCDIAILGVHLIRAYGKFIDKKTLAAGAVQIVRDILFRLPAKIDYRAVPWVIAIREKKSLRVFTDTIVLTQR